MQRKQFKIIGILCVWALLFVGCHDDSMGPSDAKCTWTNPQGEHVMSDCGTGEQCCSGGCVDIGADANNCGSCGRVCASGAQCKSGECVSQSVQCGGKEVNLSALHMRDCEQCAPQWGNCNEDWSDGCEVDLRSDAQHCNACNMACGAGEQCYFNACVLKCAYPESLCMGENGAVCVNTTEDIANCGACGRSCEAVSGAGVVCDRGQCKYTCEAGSNCAPVDTAPVCIDVMASDANNCGGCGVACRASVQQNTAQAECKGGSCALTCAQGFGDCDASGATGCETSLRFSAEHCGACNTPCAAPGQCVDGKCCFRNCSGKRCGSDGCGGICGSCPVAQVCNAAGDACEGIADNIGCSDLTREGYLDLVIYDKIAACGGAWNVPGIHHNEGPACGRKAGNMGENFMGEGCNVEDLCAEGWHVCLGKDDLKSRTTLGCGDIMAGLPAGTSSFFLTRTSSTGTHHCAPDTIGSPVNANDIFGCGNMGYLIADAGASQAALCDPLTRASNNNCMSLDTSAWDCYGPITDGWHEADYVTKKIPDISGGVLCCKDQCQQDLDCPKGSYCAYHVCVPCREDAHCPSPQKCLGHVCK